MLMTVSSLRGCDPASVKENKITTNKNGYNKQTQELKELLASGEHEDQVWWGSESLLCNSHIERRTYTGNLLPGRILKICCSQTFTSSKNSSQLLIKIQILVLHQPNHTFWQILVQDVLYYFLISLDQKTHVSIFSRAADDQSWYHGGPVIEFAQTFWIKTLEGKPSKCLPNKCFLCAMRHPLSSGVQQ